VEDGEPLNVLTIVPPRPAADGDGDGEDPPLEPAPLDDWIDAAFGHGYDRYLSAIGPLLGAGDDLESKLPSLVIDVRAEWGEEGGEAVDSEEIVFDGELLATLLELYVVDGWEPIVEIGRQIGERLDRLRKAREASGGVSPEALELALWEPVDALFRLARNAVGLLVREELAAIETLAGERLDAQIATGQDGFSGLAGQLQWTRVDVRTVVQRTGDTETVQRPQLKDRDLAETFKKALEDAVRCRRQLDLTLAELARVNADARNAGPGGGTGAGPGGGGGTGGAQGGGGGATVGLERAVVQAREFAKVAKEQLTTNSPLLLLVLPALRPGFGTTEMESELYDQVEGTRATLAELREAVLPKVPHTTEVARGVDVKTEPPLFPALLAADPPALGIEAEMAMRAADGLAGASSWFALLSERTLHALVADGAIAADSLTYVVYAHYVQALAAQLDRRARDEEASREFWLRFSKLAAAASLASLLVPATAAVGAAVRAAAAVGDLLLLGSRVWSVTEELRRIQRLSGQAVAESSTAVEALGQLGDLLSVRQDLLDGLAEDAVMMLLMHLVSLPDVQLIRRGLVAYGFYQDVEVLLAPDAAAEEEE
jgi:hypothetical protein